MRSGYYDQTTDLTYGLFGDIRVRGGIIVDNVTFLPPKYSPNIELPPDFEMPPTGFSIKDTDGKKTMEPSETYANASVVVKNSTMNTDIFRLHAQNDPVFQGNKGVAEAEVYLNRLSPLHQPCYRGNCRYSP